MAEILEVSGLKKTYKNFELLFILILNYLFILSAIEKETVMFNRYTT